MGRFGQYGDSNFQRSSVQRTTCPAKKEESANIVVLLATGALAYTRYGTTAQTGPKFKFDELHGQTSLFQASSEMLFAVTFLPGKVPNPTKGQKEVIIVHEFYSCQRWNGERRTRLYWYLFRIHANS